MGRRTPIPACDRLPGRPPHEATRTTAANPANRKNRTKNRKTKHESANEKIHILRAAKYFLGLCVLVAGATFLLCISGLSAGTPGDLLRILTDTTRGRMLVVIAVVLSVLWPRLGFATLRMRGAGSMPRERLDEAFRRADYVPHDTREGIVVYHRAASFVKRLLLRFDDAVTVRRDGADLENGGRAQGSWSASPPTWNRIPPTIMNRRIIRRLLPVLLTGAALLRSSAPAPTTSVWAAAWRSQSI